jgi:triphosphoribosyl-dephospho-CoA synthase
MTAILVGPASGRSEPLTTAHCVTLAAIMEATAPKPGNVHRGADFEDITYPDFVLAAVAIGPILGADDGSPLGSRVLRAVEATRGWIGTNANLGIILLLTPLAMAARETEMRAGIRHVLGQLTEEDTRDVYQAIRIAKPGALGRTDTADVREDPPPNLVEAMRLAAGRDMIARQYAEDFADVLGGIVPSLAENVAQAPSLSSAIVHTHVQLMAQWPDSLIARKLGSQAAQQSARNARRVLDAGVIGSPQYQSELADLDFWLRSDGHRRNPGTTADLIAAGLFVLLRDGTIQPPFRLADVPHD